MEQRDGLNDLSRLVDDLTTSGSPTLDEDVFKQVKNICKTSDECVKHLYRLVMTQLEKDHAEIRVSCLQIINEIFLRSHTFRVLLTDNLQEFFVLTVGTDCEKPLPEPSSAAIKLRNQTVQALEKWNDKFGQYYKKLALGYKYLKKVKKFEFDGMTTNTAVERNRVQAGVERQATHSGRRQNKVLTEMAETVPEIRNLITEMGNCFRLVLPSLEEFDIYDIENNNCDIQNANIPTANNDCSQASTSKGYYEPSTSDCKESETNNINYDKLSNLNITISKIIDITESDENADVLNTLREQCKHITATYLPLVQKWLDILIKQSVHKQNLVEAIDLKNSLLGLQEKFKTLRIKQAKSKKRRVSEEKDDVMSDCEDDFIEVPEKAGIEHVADKDRNDYGLEPLMQKIDSKDDKQNGKPSTSDTFFWSPNGPDHPEELDDPCSRATAVAALVKNQRATSNKNIEQNPTKSVSSGSGKALKNKTSLKPDEKREDLLKIAPVLPFDMDLYHWGKEEDEAPSVSSLKSLHCFWVHGNDDNEEHCPGDLKESMKSRSIKFTGEFQEIKWSCRAPLPSGKLCPRKDKFKCPFHGTVIPRDETGQATDGSFCESESQRNTIQEKEQITKEIELATGLSLTKNSIKKGKKRKHSGLTDLKKVANTSRSRLEKVVFDKHSLDRVASETDRVKKNLIDEKFGNKWNYALSK